MLVRIDVYVRPGSSTTWVGGDFDGTLVIHVREKAIDGHATAAAMNALALALDLPPSSLRLVRGAKSRSKVIDADVPDATTATASTRLNGLRARTNTHRDR